MEQDVIPRDSIIEKYETLMIMSGLIRVVTHLATHAASWAFVLVAASVLNFEKAESQ
jgi:hypothetical protein